MLAREIGRPYLEVGCLAQLAYAYIFPSAGTPKMDSFATTQRRCREAVALIYAKPGVGDRSSAVRRARELRLLTAASRTR